MCKKLATFGMLLVLLLAVSASIAPSLMAEGPGDVPTAADLAALAPKMQLANADWQRIQIAPTEDRQALNAFLASQKALGVPRDGLRTIINVSANSPTGWWKLLPQERYWYETNDYAHRNYCGPAATQVVLDVRLPAYNVPGQDTIGQEEYINPASGVYANNIKPVLNRRLNTSWYIVSNASNMAALKLYISLDVNSNWGLMTGIKTQGMPGWGTRNVNHIVAITGYYYSTDPSVFYLEYAETGRTAQGFSGTYWNYTSLSTFWNWVKNNNVQVW